MTDFFRFASRRFWVWGAGLLWMGAAGCAALDQRDPTALEAAYGPNVPRMEAHFAGESVSPNEVWRIYLKGSDADGDLQHIHVWLHMAGRAFTPARISVAPGNGGQVSGFLALNTFEFGADENLFRRPVRLLVTLEDRAGHRSETAIVSAQFYQGARQMAPPQGTFDERLLGRIPLEFIPRDSTGGDQDRRPGRIP